MDIKIDQSTVICFDLDDTLYNELEYLKSAYNEVAKKVSPDDWLSLYAKMFSLYRKKENVFDYLVSNFDVDIKELLVIYREHLPIIDPFEGVLNLLKDIKVSGGKLCVITDGRSLTQRNKLKSLGLIDLFDKVVISEEIGSEKPSENNFLVIEEEFPNSTYYYIGDNFKKDFIIPNQRNWNSIGILDNGLNIHNNTYDYFTDENIPNAITKYVSEISIISKKS